MDGGARGNPGPRRRRRGRLRPRRPRPRRGRGHARPRDEQRRRVPRRCCSGSSARAALGATEVDVVNDAELIAKQVNGEYKVKHADLQPLHAQAIAALRRVRPLERPLGAARRERGRRRARQPRARRRGDRARSAAPRADDGRRDGLRDVPADRRPAAAPAPAHAGAHDELLFIVVHQAYELWFKLILHELTTARDALEDGRPHVAAPRLRRTIAVERLLLDQLEVLETMSPEGFLAFRDPLAPASGFQSRQFREIEWLSGERDTWPGGGDPPAGASLYEAFSRRPRPARRTARRGWRRSPSSTATTPRPAARRVARGRRAARRPRRGRRRAGATTTR